MKKRRMWDETFFDMIKKAKPFTKTEIDKAIENLLKDDFSGPYLTNNKRIEKWLKEHNMWGGEEEKDGKRTPLT